MLISQGTQAGVFQEAEQEMVEGIFSLGDLRVYSLMTPRTEVVWLDMTDTIEEIRVRKLPIARFRVSPSGRIRWRPSSALSNHATCCSKVYQARNST